jgi:predicted amidohydrolase YtcJ
VEDRLGSLEVGKLADVVVLTGDLFSTPPERIPELRVATTVVGGELAFARTPATVRA